MLHFCLLLEERLEEGVSIKARKYRRLEKEIVINP